MFFRNTLPQPIQSPSQARRTKRRRSRVPLAFETLERRAVPATLVMADSVFSPEIFGQHLFDYNEPGFVGFGNAITDPSGEVVVEGGGGDARIEIDGQLNFTSTTRMEIASISKLITAAATVKLLSDQGKSLTDTIGEYFPASWDVDGDVASLTFEDLLLHNTGFDVRRVKYADLKEAVANGPDTVQTPDYNTTNYSLLRILLPYAWFDENRQELDDLPEPGDELGADADTSSAAVGDTGWLDGIGANKDSMLSYYYLEYVRTQLLEPLGIVNASAGHTSDTPTLIYFFGDEDTPGYETPSQHLHIGGMGWNLSANEVARFLAGLGNHPEFTDYYQTMKTSLYGLSDTFSSLYGTMYAKGGNNFSANDEDGGSGTGPTRVHTMSVDLPNDYQVAVLRNSNSGGSGGTIQEAYENAWTGVVVRGDSGDNDFEVRINPADSNLLDLVVDGALFYSFQTNVLESLELRGDGGTDTFLIEDVPSGVTIVVKGASGSITMNASSGAIVAAGGDTSDVFRPAIPGPKFAVRAFSAASGPWPKSARS